MKIGKLRSAIPLAIALCVMLLTLSFFRRATKLPEPPPVRVGMTWGEVMDLVQVEVWSGTAPGGWGLSYTQGPNIWGEVQTITIDFDLDYRVTRWNVHKYVPESPRPQSPRHHWVERILGPFGL